MSTLSKPNFSHYPSPKESITTRTRQDAPSNPVLSGWLLGLAARLLASSSYLQKFLWRLNKFDELKSLPEVQGYSARYDGTVIPLASDDATPIDLLDLPKAQNRQHDKAFYTVSDFHDAYSSGRLTPTDVVEYLLPLITRDGETYTRHSVAYLDVQQKLVRCAASASTKRYAAGKPLSVIDGVPIAVKDEVNLKGYKKSLGSKINFKDELDETDWCVKRWEEAGAIIIGKTNMHEIGLDTTNNNPVWGTPLNPHNEGYYTGGSSGGSACTVAQGICPIALGVDGGGSIRIPSALCGLYGLKTGQSRVSIWPAEAGANTLAVCGPISPNIEDLALAYRIMAQPCPQDPVNALFPLTTSQLAIDSVDPVKQYIGIDRAWIAQSDPEVVTVFNAAVEYYVSKCGFETIDINIPLLSENQKAFSLTILAESMSALKPGQLEQLQYANQLVLNVSARHASAQDLLACARLRDRAMRHLVWLWERYPGMLILTPTLPFAGIKIRKPTDITDGYGAADPDTELRSMEYTCFGNWVGVPAITCPAGYSEQGLPIGIMVSLMSL